jgi:hypothetical protein
VAEVIIPSAYRGALIKLAEYSDTQIDELCSLLEAHPAVVTSRQVARDVADKLKTINADEGYSLLEAVIFLFYFLASRAGSRDVLLKEVTTGITTSGDEKQPKLAPPAIPNFQKNLNRFLSLSKVVHTAQALAVATDSQRLYSESKILSDLRPVFGNEVTSPPLGIVILHSLKIQFAEDGSEKEFFVGLNSADLRELQACIARALDKEASLRQFIEQSKMTLFETSV